MNKRNLIIIFSSVLVVLAILTIFVYKVTGSNSRDLISGCVPYNVSISEGEQYQAVVEWYTVDDCLGYITYGNDRNHLDFVAIDRDGLSSKKHVVVIDKILPSQNYFFVINSGDKSYGNKGVPLSFSLSSL